MIIPLSGIYDDNKKRITKVQPGEVWNNRCKDRGVEADEGVARHRQVGHLEKIDTKCELEKDSRDDQREKVDADKKNHGVDETFNLLKTRQKSVNRPFRILIEDVCWFSLLELFCFPTLHISSKSVSLWPTRGKTVGFPLAAGKEDYQKFSREQLPWLFR